MGVRLDTHIHLHRIMASVLIKRDSYLLGRGHFLNPKSDSEPEMKKERKKGEDGWVVDEQWDYV